MEKYRRIYNKENQPSSPDQLRIKAGDRPVYPYLSYTYRHFSEGNRQVIIKATGNAISKAIQVIELIKRRFAGLHQQNEISTLEVNDVYEPIQQGLDTVIRSKRLTMMQCTLSKDPLDQSHYGYQEPLPDDQVKQYQPRSQRDGPNEYGSGYNEEYQRGGYRQYGSGRGRRGYEQGGPRFRGGGRGYGYGDGRGYGYGGGRGYGYGRGRGQGYGGGRGQGYGGGRGQGYGGGRGQGYGRGRGSRAENRIYDNNYDDDNDGYEESKQGLSSGGRGSSDYNRNKRENAQQGFKGRGRGLNRGGGDNKGNQGGGRGRGEK